MFSGVAAFGSVHNTRVSPAKVIMLKVSVGRIFAIDFDMTSFALSIGNPFIEPEVSSTKINSRGRASADATRAGGSSMSMK